MSKMSGLEIRTALYTGSFIIFNFLGVLTIFKFGL